LYEPERVAETLAHATDVARAISAEYWIFADDDFNFQWANRPTTAAARMREIEQVLPLVYRSPDARVRMYFLGCVQYPDDASCHSAASVLFPAGDATSSRVAGRGPKATKSNFN